ncbi:MAG: hypothetical protein M9894_22650 [Planctomycetes bacterium]|nr:hypothetical protein [Planctomycetota bacterium]
MDVRVRGQHDPRRCAYCHDALPLDPATAAGCPGCGAGLHLACWREHGGCPVLGCGAARRAAPAGCGAARPAPTPIAWAQLVADAEAWLALGAAIDEVAWGATAPVEEAEGDAAGSSSWTSSQAA